MIEENDFIPLEVVHPGRILAMGLKDGQIKQYDFAININLNLSI